MSVPEGLCLEKSFCPEARGGSLSRGGPLSRGGLCPGGSLSRVVSLPLPPDRQMLLKTLADPNYFNFMHFGKFCQNRILAPSLPGELAPPPREIPGSATGKHYLPLDGFYCFLFVAFIFVMSLSLNLSSHKAIKSYL